MTINNFRANETNKITEPWATAMQKNGYVDPRNGEPSLRALSRETKVHTTTLAGVIYGRTEEPNTETIIALGEAFGVEPSVVAEWVGQKWVYGAPWTPPQEAYLMTPQEREIVEGVIKTFAKNRQRRG